MEDKINFMAVLGFDGAHGPYFRVGNAALSTYSLFGYYVVPMEI